MNKLLALLVDESNVFVPIWKVNASFRNDEESLFIESLQSTTIYTSKQQSFQLAEI